MSREDNMGNTLYRIPEEHVSEPSAAYRAVLIVLVFAGLIAATLGAQPAEAQQNTGEVDEQQTAELDYKPDEIEMVGLINDYREQEGLEPLLVSDTASLAAKRHSEDMARYGFMDHDTQQSAYFEPGASFDERMDQSGYDHETARAENIAAGAGVEETFEGWRESPEHAKNMLDPEMEVIGIGLSQAPASQGSEGSTDEGYDTYWTTDFGAHADETATEASEIEAAPDGSDSGTGEQPKSEQQDETSTGDQYEQESGDDPGEGSSTGEDDTTTRSTDEEDGASEDQYSSGDEDSSDDDPSGGSGEDASTGEGGDAGEQTAEDPDSSDQTSTEENTTDITTRQITESDTGEEGEDGQGGQQSSSDSGDGDCDTLAGFERSPFDEDFGSELTSRIKEKVDCKLANAGGGGEDGEDGSVSSDSTEMEGEQTTSQTTIVEESSGESETGGDSSDSSSDSSGEDGASVLGPTSGGSGQSEDSGRES